MQHDIAWDVLVMRSCPWCCKYGANVKDAQHRVLRKDHHVELHARVGFVTLGHRPIHCPEIKLGQNAIEHMLVIST